MGELGQPRALHRRRERQPEHHRQGSRDAQPRGVPQPLRVVQRTAVAGAGEGRGGLRRELDLDLEPADAARCRRLPTALEEGRADRRTPGNHGPGSRRHGRVPGLGRAFLREAVRLHEGRALSRRGSRAAARHEGDAGVAGTSVRHEGPRMAAGELAHGAGRQRPGRRLSPVLAALGVGEPPLRHHRPRGVRPRAVQAALREAGSPRPAGRPHSTSLSDSGSPRQ